MHLLSEATFRFLTALKRYSFNQAHELVSEDCLPKPSPQWVVEVGDEQETPLVKKTKGFFLLTEAGSRVDLEMLRVDCSGSSSLEAEPGQPSPGGVQLPNPPLTSPCGRNLTARWLDLNYKPVHAALLKMVRLRFAVSSKAGMAEDHIQQFFMVLIRRDGLASRIRAGKTIWIPSIRSWAWNQINTQIRDFGRRPLMRHRLHARTPKERAEALALKAPTVKLSPLARASFDVNSPVSLDGSWVSPYTADYAAVPEDCLQIIRAILRQNRVIRTDAKLGVWKRRILDGESLADIAREEGMSVDMAQKYVQEVKKTLKASRESLVRAIS